MVKKITINNKKKNKYKYKKNFENKQKQIIVNNNSKLPYKKQKKSQTHCHLCHKLISRTHYHSHINHNHKSYLMNNIHDKNITSSSHSSSNINLKNIDNEKNTGQIKQLKTSKNIEFYSQNKGINKFLPSNEFEWPLFDILYKDRNLEAAIIYKKRNNKNQYECYEFKEIKTNIHNSKRKYEIPELIKEMPKNFSIFSTMAEFKYVKTLIKDNHKEYMLSDLEETKNHYLSCFRIDVIDEEYLNWKVTINLTSKNEKYKKIVNILINFPKNYPFESPIIKKISRISDINIISSSGEILLDTIKHWNSSQSISDVLGEIKEILIKNYNYNNINYSNKSNLNKKNKNIYIKSQKNKEIEITNNKEDDIDIQNEIDGSKNDFDEPIPKKKYCDICKKIFKNYLQHIKSENHLKYIDKEIIAKIKSVFKNITFNNIKKNKNERKENTEGSEYDKYIKKKESEKKDIKNNCKILYSISNLSYMNETPSYLKDSESQNETIIELIKTGILPKTRHIYYSKYN